MRERPFHNVRPYQLRYTITYSDGMPVTDILGNCTIDTPSHTVREQYENVSKASQLWYTLTYSEGTAECICIRICSAIHPHIQWGNLLHTTGEMRRGDTPSHTVREHRFCGDSRLLFRYILTYSEGTGFRTIAAYVLPIHPHIQWGNSSSPQSRINTGDTPSHTVREPQ